MSTHDLGTTNTGYEAIDELDSSNPEDANNKNSHVQIEVHKKLSSRQISLKRDSYHKYLSNFKFNPWSSREQKHFWSIYYKKTGISIYRLQIDNF